MSVMDGCAEKFDIQILVETMPRGWDLTNDIEVSGALIYNKIPKEQLPDLTIWNQMIRGLARGAIESSQINFWCESDEVSYIVRMTITIRDGLVRCLVCDSQLYSSDGKTVTVEDCEAPF